MVTEVTAERADARRPGTEGPIKGFRPDVEGLRAVAVGLVLLYHARLPFIPGGFVGVDVFFVISGFLITGLLVKELSRSGTVSIAGFYARRAKRLLPAAAVVLVSIAALTLIFLPGIRWSEIGGDIVAAALYLVNWRLADRSVDYLAEDSAASPVQHFWSLAVEEQFYLVWPLLLLLAAFWARRRGQTLRHELWIGLALIAIPSFAWSLYQTASESSVAFFVTTTRMWELAIGAAVALGAATLTRIPRTLAIVMGWSGLAAIMLSAFVYSTSTAWPGYAAALPTLGTAAVIAAGFAAGPTGPIAILGTRPFTWIGGLSYSLYLWHWPLIVAAATYFGSLSPLRGLVIVVLCVIPAWLTQKLVENPIRFSQTTFKVPANSLKLGAVLTACGVAAGFGIIGVHSLATGPTPTTAPGAAVLGKDPAQWRPPDRVDAMTPDPFEATDDVPDAYDRDCTVAVRSAGLKSCEYGDRDGDVTIALVGDSKALQWISALDAIGDRRGWRVVLYSKSACPFAAVTVLLDGAPNTTCANWNDAVTAVLLRERPDLVLTSQVRQQAMKNAADVSAGQSVDVMVNGLVERWERLRTAGIAVAVLRDNPGPTKDVRPVYECVDEHRDQLARCVFDRRSGERRSAGDVQARAVKAVEAVEMIDLNDYLCPGDSCPPVIGNVLIYRQGSHLTKTYVDTLAPELERRLTPIVAKATG